jgi:hypothetical protein
MGIERRNYPIRADEAEAIKLVGQLHEQSM